MLGTGPVSSTLLSWAVSILLLLTLDFHGLHVWLQRTLPAGETPALLKFEGGRTAPKNHEGVPRTFAGDKKRSSQNRPDNFPTKNEIKFPQSGTCSGAGWKWVMGSGNVWNPSEDSRSRQCFSISVAKVPRRMPRSPKARRKGVSYRLSCCL